MITCFTAEDVVWGVVKAVPFVAATGAAAYFYYKAMTIKDSGRVNIGLSKDVECVRTSVFQEDIGDQAAYCRCWRSSKVFSFMNSTAALSISNFVYYHYNTNEFA